MTIWSSRSRLLGVLSLGWAIMLSSPSAPRAEQLEIWRAATVPRLSLRTLDGGALELEKQLGSLVIVHFFATWCEPCRDELTSLERLAAAYTGCPFRILAIDVGEPGDRVRRFFERSGFSVRYPVLLDFDKQAMKTWGVEILPTSFVLDAALCPLWKVAGALDWDIDPTRSTLDSKIVELERGTIRPTEEHCIVKGGNQ